MLKQTQMQISDIPHVHFWNPQTFLCKENPEKPGTNHRKGFAVADTGWCNQKRKWNVSTDWTPESKFFPYDRLAEEIDEWIEKDC